MHTLSSARRTCMASSSAVELTATDGIPSSLQARSTRNAISPRFAIRILSNISTTSQARARGAEHSLYDHQGFAEFHRLTIRDQNLDHRAASRGGNLIHGLHGFDDEERVAGLHPAADFDEGTRTRFRPDISGPDHWRSDDARMLGGIDRCGFGDEQTQVRSRSEARRAGDERLHLSPHAHALPVAFELDFAQPGLLEQAGKLAHELGINRELVLAPALAAHEPSSCAASRSARPSRRWRAHNRRRRSRTGWLWQLGRRGNDGESSRARKCC